MYTKAVILAMLLLALVACGSSRQDFYGNDLSKKIQSIAPEIKDPHILFVTYYPAQDTTKVEVLDGFSKIVYTFMETPANISLSEKSSVSESISSVAMACDLSYDDIKTGPRLAFERAKQQNPALVIDETWQAALAGAPCTDSWTLLSSKQHLSLEVDIDNGRVHER